MKRSLGLDVMRGVAALMIVIHHAQPGMLPDMPRVHGAMGYMLWRVRSLGWTGIDLFFVLGGFFIGNAIFTDLDREGCVRLRTYWRKRAARILPSYYLLLLVLAVTGASGFVDFSSLSGTLRDALVHMLFLNNYLDQLPNGPTWFLAAMVHFYLLAPLCCALLSRHGPALLERGFPRLSIGLVAFTLALRVGHVATGAHTANDFMLTHFRVDSVLIGMLAIYLLKTNHKLVTWIRARWRISLCASLLLIAPAMFFPRKDPLMFTVGFTLLACGYGGLILLVVAEELSHSLRWLTGLAAISACSYNVYLWHYFLPGLFASPYAGMQRVIQALSSSVAAVTLAQIVAYVLVSVGFGYAVTALVERPATRWLSRSRESSQ